MLNEKGMVPKDKGVGDVKPWSMGENPCVATLFCFATFPCQPLQCFQLVVEELWLLVVGDSYCLWSGVAGLSVLCPHAHSTHDLPFTPLHPCQFTFTAASDDAHVEQRSVHSSMDIPFSPSSRPRIQGTVCSFLMTVCSSTCIDGAVHSQT